MSLLEWVRKNRPNDLKVRNYNSEKENDKKITKFKIKKN
jgi:acylphosphatase